MKKRILIILILVFNISVAICQIEKKEWAFVATTDVDGKLVDADANTKFQLTPVKKNNVTEKNNPYNGTYRWGYVKGKYILTNKELTLYQNDQTLGIRKYSFSTCGDDYLKMWNLAYTWYFIYKLNPYKDGM